MGKRVAKFSHKYLNGMSSSDEVISERRIAMFRNGRKSRNVRNEKDMLLIFTYVLIYT